MSCGLSSRRVDRHIFCLEVQRRTKLSKTQEARHVGTKNGMERYWQDGQVDTKFNPRSAEHIARLNFT